MALHANDHEITWTLSTLAEQLALLPLAPKYGNARAAELDLFEYISVFAGALEESARRWRAVVKKMATKVVWSGGVKLAVAPSKASDTALKWQKEGRIRLESWENLADELPAMF